MKIVQLIPALNEGGVERGVVDINREFVKLGHTSIVISSGGRLTEQIKKDGGIHIELNVASKNPFLAPFRAYELYKILKQEKPDILHARSRVPAWLAFIANKFLRIPFVTTVHGFNSVNFYSSIMTKGDRVICVSEAINEHIQTHYSTHPNKIRVVPRGIDLATFNPENLDTHFMEDFKNKYSLNHNYIISSVGRITQLKDHETLIKSIAILKNEIPNIKALIVGGVHKDKKEYFSRLQRLVEDLKIEGNIIFTGSQSKIAEIYSLSNIIISSSKKPESFGRSAAEAIAMNRPVIATNHGGITEIVIDNKTGYLIPIESPEILSAKILEVKNKEWVNLREHITENFSLEQMVTKTLKVYEELLVSTD